MQILLGPWPQILCALTKFESQKQAAANKGEDKFDRQLDPASSSMIHTCE